MSRDIILESMYKVINSSLSWGIDNKSYAYGYFVDGVVAVTEELLKECNNPTLAEALKNYSEQLGTNKEDA